MIDVIDTADLHHYECVAGHDHLWLESKMQVKCDDR